MTDNDQDLRNMRLTLMEIIGDCTQIHSHVGWPNERGVWKVTFSRQIDHEALNCINEYIAGFNLRINTAAFNVTAPTFCWLEPFTREKRNPSTPRGSREVDKGTGGYRKKIDKRDNRT